MNEMNDQQFEMGMQMHRDTHELIKSIKSDIVTLAEKLDAHVQDDQKVHAVVTRHTAYWKTLSGGLTAIAGYLGLSR